MSTENSLPVDHIYLTVLRYPLLVESGDLKSSENERYRRYYELNAFFAYLIQPQRDDKGNILDVISKKPILNVCYDSFLEKDLDKIVLHLQQQREEIDRTEDYIFSVYVMLLRGHSPHYTFSYSDGLAKIYRIHAPYFVREPSKPLGLFFSMITGLLSLTPSLIFLTDPDFMKKFLWDIKFIKEDIGLSYNILFILSIAWIFITFYFFRHEEPDPYQALAKVLEIQRQKLFSPSINCILSDEGMKKEEIIKRLHMQYLLLNNAHEPSLALIRILIMTLQMMIPLSAYSLFFHCLFDKECSENMAGYWTEAKNFLLFQCLAVTLLDFYYRYQNNFQHGLYETVRHITERGINLVGKGIKSCYGFFSSSISSLARVVSNENAIPR